MITRGRRTGVWAAALVALASLVRADEGSVRAEVDATRVGVADQVQLTITIQGGAADVAADVALPPLKNLRLLGGPSTSEQVTFVNGATSQSRAYTYVLQPIAPGKAEVGAVHVKLPGGVKATAPIAIDVVPGSVGPRPARRRSPFDEAFGDPFESLFGRGRRTPRAEPKLKVVATASRPKLHVGEPVLITYFVYTQVSVASIQLAEAAQYAGFWTEDVDQPKTSPAGERVTFEGESYVRFPIQRKLLFPARAGRLTIPPVRFRLNLARMSFFDAGGTVERSTTPLSLDVEALPEEPGFAGAVGEFDVKASLDRDTVALGEAATLRFTVQGRGNLKWVDRAPELSLPGAKVYPPQTRSDLKVGPEGINGSRTWEFVVVPETSGALAIPPLPFTYFAPSTGMLRRTRTSPLTLRVRGGAATAAAGPLAAPGALTSSRGAGLALRSDLDPPRRRLPVLGPGAVLATLGLLVVLHGAIGGAALLADRRRLAAGRPAARSDVRGALGDLERAGRGQLGKEEAAALIERTLHGIFGAMTENGGPPAGEREKAVRDVLQQVQFIRYAPQLGDYSEAIRDVAVRAADVVRKWA